MQNDKVQRKEHSKMEEINSELKLQRFQVLFGKKMKFNFSSVKDYTRLQKKWREKMARK